MEFLGFKIGTDHQCRWVDNDRFIINAELQRLIKAAEESGIVVQHDINNTWFIDRDTFSLRFFKGKNSIGPMIVRWQSGEKFVHVSNLIYEWQPREFNANWYDTTPSNFGKVVDDIIAKMQKQYPPIKPANLPPISHIFVAPFVAKMNEQGYWLRAQQIKPKDALAEQKIVLTFNDGLVVNIGEFVDDKSRCFNVYVKDNGIDVFRRITTYDLSQCLDDIVKQYTTKEPNEIAIQIKRLYTQFETMRVEMDRLYKLVEKNGINHA